MDFRNFANEFIEYTIITLALLACFGVAVGVGLIMWIFIHPIISLIWLVVVIFGLIKAIKNNM